MQSGALGGIGEGFGVYKTTGPIEFQQVTTSAILSNGVYSLNLYEKDFSNGNSASITQGQQAFVGTTTITLNADSYKALVDGPSSGKIWAFTDNDLFATQATHIGDWATVPEPSTAIAMGLLGVVGFAGNRRRRRSATV